MPSRGHSRRCRRSGATKSSRNGSPTGSTPSSTVRSRPRKSSTSPTPPGGSARYWWLSGPVVPDRGHQKVCSYDYRRLRRHAPRMLRTLDIACASVAELLVAALSVIGNGAGTPARPVTFLRPRSKWRPRLNACATGDDRLWQVAVLFHMRDAFRSGEIWLAHSRRYGDLKQALVPIAAVRAAARLAVPFEPQAWIAERKARMDEGLNRLATPAREGTIPGGAIETEPVYGDTFRRSALGPSGAGLQIRGRLSMRANRAPWRGAGRSPPAAASRSRPI